jgi:hypothetical protein
MRKYQIAPFVYPEVTVTNISKSPQRVVSIDAGTITLGAGDFDGDQMNYMEGCPGHYALSEQTMHVASPPPPSPPAKHKIEVVKPEPAHQDDEWTHSIAKPLPKPYRGKKVR